MKLTLERIGAIQNATIDLVGLTVIAGENDTGKSTIGKVSFALVQAFSSFPIAVRKSIGSRFRREIEMLYFEIRRYIDVAQHPDVRRYFSSLRIHSEDVQGFPFSDVEKVIDSLESSGSYDVARAKDGVRLAAVRRRLDRLRREFEETASDERTIGRLVHQALSSEFAGEIQYGVGDMPAKLSLTDGATTVVEMELTNSDVVKFNGGDPLGFRDATLVDGPSILQYFPAISGYDGFGYSYGGAIPYHTIDLANKLKGANRRIKYHDEAPGRVCDVFSGEVVYDNKKENFYLRRAGLTIPSVNIASGIKALSIIDLLRSGDYIGDDTLLILDEPETNLHPKWQMAYARAICELSRAGARILVTTHSPYMLEALKGYCGEDVESKFYYSERRGDDSVRYVDTMGDISPIIGALSRPLVDFLEEVAGGGDDF